MNNVIQFPNGATIDYSDINSFEVYLYGTNYHLVTEIDNEVYFERISPQEVYLSELTIEEKMSLIKDTMNEMSYYLNEIELWRK